MRDVIYLLFQLLTTTTSIDVIRAATVPLQQIQTAITSLISIATNGKTLSRSVSVAGNGLKLYFAKDSPETTQKDLQVEQCKRGFSPLGSHRVVQFM